MSDTAVRAATPTIPRLHIPSEPFVQREVWLDAVLGGDPLLSVIETGDGVAEWLWQRWRVLETAGLDREGFRAIVVAYRREVWLWMAGERTWQQCCSGLLGRVGRRIS